MGLVDALGLGSEAVYENGHFLGQESDVKMDGLVSKELVNIRLSKSLYSQVHDIMSSGVHMVVLHGGVWLSGGV